MAANRISFDSKDAKFIRKAMDQIGDSMDAKRISGKIKMYLDVLNGKAPSKAERIAANAKAREEKAQAPKAPKTPKAPAEKTAKATAEKPAKAPKAFDAED